jgi:hypothetical protein
VDLLAGRNAKPHGDHEPKLLIYYEEGEEKERNTRGEREKEKENKDSLERGQCTHEF